MAERPKVLLGVTGSIAAYKAVELLRLMMKRDWDVWVVMTTAATQYVGPLTFRALSLHPVAYGDQAHVSVDTYSHLSLADNARAFVIAPCTANTMAKIVYGFAADIVSATALSVQCPMVLAPAMNVNMWTNPTTQANLNTLKERGASIVAPESGRLACGAEGLGRLCDLNAIMAAVEPLVQNA